MAGGVGANNGLQFNFSWPRSRALHDLDIFEAVPIAPTLVPIAREAARIFRETTPRDDYEFVGPSWDSPLRLAGSERCVDCRLIGEAIASGQWRAMRDGRDGIPGNRGNVVSVSYRL